jgi:hypothetical protein
VDLHYKVVAPVAANTVQIRSRVIIAMAECMKQLQLDILQYIQMVIPFSVFIIFTSIPISYVRISSKKKKKKKKKSYKLICGIPRPLPFLAFPTYPDVRTVFYYPFMRRNLVIEDSNVRVSLLLYQIQTMRSLGSLR